MIQTFEHNPENQGLGKFPSFQIKTVENLEKINSAQKHVKHYDTFPELQMIHEAANHPSNHQHHHLHNLHSGHHQSRFHPIEPIHNQAVHNHQLSQSAKRNQPKSAIQVFMEAKKVLKKTPQIRTPADNHTLLQLLQHNQFLANLVQNINVQCFKGLMKQAKIQEVRERQLLCEEGKPISHIVILLDGKLGICKQQDDFLQYSQGNKTPTSLRSSTNGQIDMSPSKNHGKQKQNKTVHTIVPMDNIFDELTAISCKQIQSIRKKNTLLKRKSSIPLTAGQFLPSPYSKERFNEYEIQTFVNPGEQYGAKTRCRSKIHTNSVFAVQKSILLIIEFNLLIYWFEHSFRTKLGATIQKLRKIPAFSFLEEGKLAECILHMNKEKRKRNDFIYKQGSQSQKLYILLHGEVKISKQAKLFEQNPNELYVDRRKLMQMSTDLSQKQDDNKKIEILPYANLTTLYNFRPMKKNIDLGIITSNNQCFSLLGQEELIEKIPRQTSAQVISFDCQFYQIEIKKLQDILGSKFVEDFYKHLGKSLKKVILYRQNQYAGKVNLQNRQNLDYFYYENDKTKESPRKYKLQKINNKFNDTQTSNFGIKTLPLQGKNLKVNDQEVMKPYYTTFNFHKLMRTQRLTHARGLSQRENRANSSRKRKDSDDSQEITKFKFDPVEERLIDISHTWKPIKKKVNQQIKVMEKISKKRHSININEPLIQQKYFTDMQKEQKRIDRQHKIFKLSLGKRTKW